MANQEIELAAAAYNECAAECDRVGRELRAKTEELKGLRARRFRTGEFAPVALYKTLECEVKLLGIKHQELQREQGRLRVVHKLLFHERRGAQTKTDAELFVAEAKLQLTGKEYQAIWDAVNASKESQGGKSGD